MEFDIIKSLVIFAHVIACAIALGLVLYMDISLFHHRKSELPPQLLRDLRTLPDWVYHALIGLWATGLAIVALGIQSKGLTYLDNPKLWVKILVVSTLTVNGVLLHKYVLPILSTTTNLVELAKKQRFKMAIIAGVSSSSWLVSTYLGVARYMNGTLNFSTVFLFYVSVLSALVVICCWLLVPGLEKLSHSTSSTGNDSV